jgi:hypothetical protein
MPLKVATRATFQEKKKKMMNNNQITRHLFFFFVSFIFKTTPFWLYGFNLAILSKFNLVLRLLISFNCTPDWFQAFNFIQFWPCQTSISPSNFSAILILILGLEFMQIDL